MTREEEAQQYAAVLEAAVGEANEKILDVFEKWMGHIDEHIAQVTMRSEIKSICEYYKSLHNIEPVPASNVFFGTPEGSNDIEYRPFLWQLATDPPILLEGYYENPNSEDTSDAQNSGTSEETTSLPSS